MRGIKIKPSFITCFSWRGEYHCLGPVTVQIWAQKTTVFNKAFIDIWRRPGIATAKREVVHKTGSAWRIATPPEEDWTTATGDLHNKFRKDRSSGSIDMLADRQTHTDNRTGTQSDRQTDRNTPLPYRGGVIINVAVGLPDKIP